MLTWFVSPVGIPCRPWVEAAYRNGVKIIGTVFTDGPGLVALTQKDAAGNNPASPRTSLAVFAPNLTFNGGLNSFNSNPADYQNFYNTEVRLFAGDDLDITTADARGWLGFGYYQPVRCALTAAEIGANACGVPATSTALAAYWQCNDSPSLTAADASGHGHPGTLSNMAASDRSIDAPAQCATVTATRPASASAGLHRQHCVR